MGGADGAPTPEGRSPVSDDRLTRAGLALADRFGQVRAAAFARVLPTLVRGIVGRWDLAVEDLYEAGATSVVLAVRTAAQQPAVLKLSPDPVFLDHQVAMLLHLAPTGRVPRVIASEAGAVLMEQIVPGHPVASLRAAPPTPAQWAELLSDVHSTTVTGVEGFLEQRCEEMFERIGARQGGPKVRPYVPQPAWEAAVRTCRTLLHTGEEQVVIHGDLHLGNVLEGGDHGLVVIDPKLCLGDRCFDMVDFVLIGDDPHVWIARLRALAPLVGLGSPLGVARLLAWSRVNAVVTAVSRTDRSGPDARTAALLAFAAGGT